MITENGDHASGVCVSTSLAGFAVDGGGPGRTEVTARLTDLRRLGLG